MKSIALAIFCKYPEIGYVKTRLAKVVGKTSALKIYTKLLQNTISQANSLIDSNSDINIFYFIDRSERKKEFELFLKNYTEMESGSGQRVKIEIQHGRDIGERMANAFEKLFNSGYSEVIIIGTDIVGDLLGELKNAFALLRMKEIVVGPSYDGGFYLIGCRDRFNKDIFQNIKWSTQDVFNRLISNIEDKGYEYSSTNKLYDIDTYEDFKRGLSDNLITDNGDLYG